MARSAKQVAAQRKAAKASAAARKKMAGTEASRTGMSQAGMATWNQKGDGYGKMKGQFDRAKKATTAHRKSKASSKLASMTSRDAPGLGNKPATEFMRRARVNNNGKTAKRESLSDIATVTRKGNRARSVTRGEALTGRRVRG